MKVTLINYTPNAAQLCGEAAAVCTASRNPERSLRTALASCHESVLEHVTFTFRVEGLSRAALAQFTRHRLASFDVQSQRYCALEDVKMVVPDTIARTPFLQDVEEAMTSCMRLYRAMCEAKVPKEDARYILPQAVETSLIVTMNAREIRHFCRLRCCNRAQWEIRGVADAMLAICKKIAPELFYGAGPACVSGNCPEMLPCGHRRSDSEWDVLPEQAVMPASMPAMSQDVHDDHVQ